MNSLFLRTPALDAPVRAALAAALPAARAALGAEQDRWRAAVRTLDAGRIRGALGLGDTPDARLADAVTEAWRERPPPLGPDVVETLARIDGRLSTPGPRAATHLIARCGPVGIAVAGPHGPVLHPVAFTAAAAAAVPQGVAAWLVAAFGLLDAAALRSRWHAVASTALREAHLPAIPADADTPLPLRLAAATHALAASPADTSAPSAIAGRLRAIWVDRLLGVAPGAIPAWLAENVDAENPADVPPWMTAQPAPLLRDDADLLASCVDLGVLALPARAYAAAWARWAADGESAATVRLFAVPGVDGGQWPPIPPGARAMTRHDAFDALRAAFPAQGSPADAWVLGPTAGPVTWVELIRLSNRAGLVAELHDQLDAPVEWNDFDAPGEGALPELWRDAAALAGRWPSLADAFATRCEVPPPASVAEILAGYPAPATVDVARLDPAAPALAAAGSGLHEGIAEAYGEVWSGADPFSSRPPRRKDGDSAGD